jgi:hypothetical protein
MTSIFPIYMYYDTLNSLHLQSVRKSFIACRKSLTEGARQRFGVSSELVAPSVGSRRFLRLLLTRCTFSRRAKVLTCTLNSLHLQSVREGVCSELVAPCVKVFACVLNSLHFQSAREYFGKS